MEMLIVIAIIAVSLHSGYRSLGSAYIYGRTKYPSKP